MAKRPKKNKNKNKKKTKLQKRLLGKAVKSDENNEASALEEG